MKALCGVAPHCAVVQDAESEVPSMIKRRHTSFECAGVHTKPTMSGHVGWRGATMCNLYVPCFIEYRGAAFWMTQLLKWMGRREKHVY